VKRHGDWDDAVKLMRGIARTKIESHHHARRPREADSDVTLERAVIKVVKRGKDG